jgi:hypothetical protein
MAQPTPLYIVASPRPRVGKTLMARLLVEFFRHAKRPLVAYDLNPREPALAGRFPELVWTVNIADTRGQVVLFDQLVAGDPVTRVIDLGDAAFDQFFAVITEIGFMAEARRKQIEPVLLFIADRAPSTMRAYAKLRQQLPSATFVPVHNEAVSVIFETEDFPPSRAECGLFRLTRLSPIVRGVIDRASFSFGAYMNDRRGGATEVHDWVGGIFAEFRTLELRLLMSRLSSTLGSVMAHDDGTRRWPPA